MARGSIFHRPPSIEDTQVLDGGAQERMVTDSDTYWTDPWPGGFETYAAEWGPEPTRIGGWTSTGLIVSLVGLCATLTGLLAPEGAAVGVLGLLISIGGLVASGRPAMTGRGVAGLGVLIALLAVVLAVLAMTGRYSWPNSRIDEITTWHSWLVGHWVWLGRW